MKVFGTPVRRSTSSELQGCWPAEARDHIPPPRYFAYLPVGLFASIMGLTGLSVAWRQAATTFGLAGWIADSIAIVALGCFASLVCAYAAKTLSAPDAVRAEFQHPVSGNLFGTIFVSILLVPIILAPIFPLTARAVWCVGALGMFGFAWLMVDRWMNDRQQVAQATPAWIIPVVGLLDLPLALPHLNLPQAHGLMVASLAIGLFFALPLFTIIFGRLVFEPALAEPLQPSLLIMVAPFAVGFSAYTATTGRVDLFAEGLYGIMLFMLVVLLARMRRVARPCPFRVAWWAVSFPLAASAATAIRFADARPGAVSGAIALGLLALASLIIGGLFVRTIAGILRGELKALT